METVTPQQALEMVKAGLAYGIDVREIDEWDAGHFDLFTLNPLSTFDNSSLPSEKPIIFICRSGNRSRFWKELLSHVQILPCPGALLLTRTNYQLSSFNFLSSDCFI